MNAGSVVRFRGEPREMHTGVHAHARSLTYTYMMDHKGQRGDGGELITECFAWIILPMVGPCLVNRI